MRSLKRKKSKAASEKRRKEPVVMLRERMNQTIRERRASERLEEGLGSDTSGGGHSSVPESSRPSESSQSVPVMIKGRRSVNHLVKGGKAFASQRRTVDRGLDSLSNGDNSMIMQIKEVEQDKNRLVGGY